MRISRVTDQARSSTLSGTWIDVGKLRMALNRRVFAETKKKTRRSFISSLQHSFESCNAIYGAGNETRTRDPDLGKVVLYQLSYSRIVSMTGRYSSDSNNDVKPLIQKLIFSRQWS